MSRRYSSHRTATRTRSRSSVTSPLIGFLLIASFGILFAGCNGPESVDGDDIVFTQDDVARYRELANEQTGSGATGSGSESPFIEPLESGSGRTTDEVVLDVSLNDTYKSLRQSAGSDGNTFVVNNDILNVRTKTNTTSQAVATLKAGDTLEVLEFVDAQWAKVKTAGGIEGYVAHRYIAKVTTDERLADEKKQYENMYYVSYGFVNVRKEPNQQSEKIGEIPGSKIVRPLGIQGEWAKVTVDGKEGYVSTSYLARFTPTFVVRQDTYTLPVLHYRLTKDQTPQLLQALSKHVDELKKQGISFITMRQFYDLLIAQQQRDVRLDPKVAIIAVSGITYDNLKAVSDALNTANVNATLFLETEQVGLAGITEKNIITLMANGFDIQSATHTGDDLRALTNAQVELEVKQSRKILEDITHKPVFAIAYPQGGMNDRVAQIAADAGYLLGLGDDADRSFTRGQFLRIPAMTVFPSMAIEEVIKFATGSAESTSSAD